MLIQECIGMHKFLLMFNSFLLIFLFFWIFKAFLAPHNFYAYLLIILFTKKYYFLLFTFYNFIKRKIKIMEVRNLINQVWWLANKYITSIHDNLSELSRITVTIKYWKFNTIYYINLFKTSQNKGVRWKNAKKYTSQYSVCVKLRFLTWF